MAMIYPKELAYYKNTSFQHPAGYPTGLQTFTELKTPRTSKLHVRQLQRILNFCHNCIHCIAYIWEPGTRRSVRIFWLSVVLLAIGGCIAMYTVLTGRHRQQVLMTVVETSHLPIYSINFPAVALCPFTHVNWIRYKAAEEKFLPHNANEDERKVFHDLLLVMESFTFTMLSSIGDVLGPKSIPASIQKIVLYDLAQFMAFRCDELFVSCFYDETKFDCCKIFVTERTERGICLVFNSLISEESKIKKLTDNFYPWRVRIGGETASLLFHLRYNKTLMRPDSTIPFAFSVIIKEAEEWSEPVYHVLYPNTANQVMVTPIITESSSSTRAIDPQKRKCLFPNEKTTKYDRLVGLPHNKLNCQVRCQEKFVLKHCNCTLSMFFPGMPELPKRECKVSDLECLYHHRDVFNYLKAPEQDEYINDTRRGMVCDCIDSCLSLVFLIAMNSHKLTNVNQSIPEIETEVFFGQSTMTKYVTRLQYTSMDLLANFGGVLGLCLGSSALSLVEIVYAILRTILVLLVMKWNQKRQKRRIVFVKSLNDCEK